MAPCVNDLVVGAFQLPPTGTFGNIGKGALRGPGLLNWDMGFFKNIPIHERSRLQFRAEFFNTFNRVNLGDPVSTITAGGFGSIRSASGSSHRATGPEVLVLIMSTVPYRPSTGE